MFLNEYCENLILSRRLSILEQELSGGFVEEAYDILNESFDEILEETTTNKEMVSKFKLDISTAKKEFSTAKKLLKGKNNTEAISHFKKSIEIIDELERYLRNINDFDANSEIFGSMIGYMLHFGLYIITSTVILSYMMVQLYNADKADKDNKRIKDQIYDMYDIDLDSSHNDGVKRVKISWTKINGVNDLETLWKKLISNSNKIQSAKDNSVKGFVAAIISSVIVLIKSTKTVMKLNSNGGLAKDSNMLRKQLIIYTMNIKSCLKGYLKFAGIKIEE